MVSRSKKLIHLQLLCFYWDLHIKVNYLFSCLLGKPEYKSRFKKKGSKPLIFPEEKGKAPQQGLPLQEYTACSSDQLTSSAGCGALLFRELPLQRVNLSKTINGLFLNNVPVSGPNSNFSCPFHLLRYSPGCVFSKNERILS